MTHVMKMRERERREVESLGSWLMMIGQADFRIQSNGNDRQSWISSLLQQTFWVIDLKLNIICTTNPLTALMTSRKNQLHFHSRSQSLAEDGFSGCRVSEVSVH